MYINLFGLKKKYYNFIIIYVFLMFNIRNCIFIFYLIVFILYGYLFFIYLVDFFFYDGFVGVFKWIVWIGFFLCF